MKPVVITPRVRIASKYFGKTFCLAKSIVKSAKSSTWRILARMSTRSSSSMGLEKPPGTPAIGWMVLRENLSRIILTMYRILTTWVASSGLALAIPTTLRTA